MLLPRTGWKKVGDHLHCSLCALRGFTIPLRAYQRRFFPAQIWWLAATSFIWSFIGFFMAKWNAFVGFFLCFFFFAPARLPWMCTTFQHTHGFESTVQLYLELFNRSSLGAARPVHVKWQVNNKRGCSLVTRGRASPLIDPQIRLQLMNNEDSVFPKGAVTSCAVAPLVCSAADGSGFATQPEESTQPAALRLG